MGTKSILMGLIDLLLNTILSGTDVNGRFQIVNSDSTKVALLLQINTNTGTDGMGGATIVIEFDTTNTSFNSNPVKNIDYVSHNFCGGNYSPATVTRPMNNKIWINIDLPFNNSSNGTVVAGSNNWTDVATIYFDKLNNNGLASFWWKTSSNFWGIYSDDNFTLWNTGQFEDLVNYSIPVELVSFNAFVQDDNSVILNWITVSTLNNLGFEIERSEKQDAGGEKWEKIGFVEGTGTSTTALEYSFKDITEHNAGTISYRLKAIDLDGSYYYSEIIEIEIAPNNFYLEQNFPNPFNPSTRIRYQVPGPGQVTLKVYDVLGNEITALVDEFKSAGKYEVDFQSTVNIKQLASGIYLYSLTTGNYTETKKMVLLQ